MLGIGVSSFSKENVKIKSFLLCLKCKSFISKVDYGKCSFEFCTNVVVVEQDLFKGLGKNNRYKVIKRMCCNRSFNSLCFYVYPSQDKT